MRVQLHQLRKIRKDPRFDKMPILMMTSMREQTGFDFPGERMHSKFLPVDDYVEKGVEPKVLLDKVEQLLAGKGGAGFGAAVERNDLGVDAGQFDEDFCRQCGNCLGMGG